MMLLASGILVGFVLAGLFALAARRGRTAPPPAPPYNPHTDPLAVASVRQMLAERDADVLRKAGNVVPDEPHHGRAARPRRAGKELDE